MNLERLKIHPCTTRELVDIYGDIDTAGHALNRLFKRGKIKRVGLYSDNPKGGKSHYVYCTRNISPHMIPHEVGLTKWCLKYDVKWLRGNKPDKRLQADAETVNSPKRYIEWDCGTMHVSEIKRRFRIYEKHKDLFEGNNAAVLWICPDRERRDELRAEAFSVGAFAVFGTRDDNFCLTVDGTEVPIDMPLVERFDKGSG